MTYNDLFPNIYFKVENYIHETTCRNVFRRRLVSNHEWKFLLKIKFINNTAMSKRISVKDNLLMYVIDVLGIELLDSRIDVDKDTTFVLDFRAHADSINPDAISTFLRNIQFYFFKPVYYNRFKIVNKIGLDEFHRLIYFISSMIRYSYEFRYKIISLLGFDYTFVYYMLYELHNFFSDVKNFLSKNSFNITKILFTPGLNSLFSSTRNSIMDSENAAYLVSSFYADVVIYDSVKLKKDKKLQNVYKPYSSFYFENQDMYSEYKDFVTFYKMMSGDSEKNIPKSSAKNFERAVKFYDYMYSILQNTEYF